MSFGRRTSTLQEIQKRQRLQPVQGWVQEWVKPQNALPGSTYRVLKWVKSDQKQHFSDDEDYIAENPTAAVVDEELEDSRLASELPETENPNAEDADDADDNADADAEAQKDAAATVAALKSLDALDPLDEAKQVEEEANSNAPEEEDPEDPDVLPLNDDMLMPTPATQIIPEPAPDGPDLAEISREQIMADAAAFAAAPPAMLDNDGVIDDNAMDFALGEP